MRYVEFHSPQRRLAISQLDRVLILRQAHAIALDNLPVNICSVFGALIAQDELGFGVDV